jgi:hypothetical protein
MGGRLGVGCVDISEEGWVMSSAKLSKRIDFTMLGKKGRAVNHRGQDARKRVGKANEIIVL